MKIKNNITLKYLILIIFILSAGNIHSEKLFSSKKYLDIQAALNDHFYVLAEKYCNQELTRSKGNEKLEYKYLMAHSLYGQKKYDEILKLISKLDKDGRAIYWRAKALYSQGYLNKAYSLLKNDQSKGNFAAERIYLKGTILKNINLIDDAEEQFLLFNVLFESHPFKLENDYNLALVYKEQGRFYECESLLNKLIISKDKNVSEKSKLLKGAILFDQNKRISEAKKILLEVIDLSSENENKIIAAEIISQININLNQISSSVEILENAISWSNISEKRISLKRDLIEILINDKRFLDALKWVEALQAEVLTKDEAIEVQFTKSDILLLLGRNDEASFSFQVILDVADNKLHTSKAYYGRGISLWNSNHPEESAIMFTQAYNTSDDTNLCANALFKAGDSFYKSGQYQEAEVSYINFLEKYSNHEKVAQANYQLGLCLARIGKRSDSLEKFEYIYKKYPSSSFAIKARFRTIDIFLSDQKWDSAINMYLEIENLSNNTDDLILSKHQRALLLYKMGSYLDSKKIFEEIILEYSSSEYALQATYMRAFCLYMLDEIEDAIDICKNFINDHPDSVWTPNVIFWLAEQAYNTQNYEDSELLFLKVHQNNPNHRLSDKSLFFAGKSAMNNSKFTAAIEHFSLLVRMFPDSNNIAKARFYHGDLLSELGEYTRAILAFEQVLKNYPQHELANSALGRIGDCQFILASEQPSFYNESLKTYQVLLDRVQDSPELKLQSIYKAGQCEYKLGNLDQAFDYYMQAVYYFINQNIMFTTPSLTWFTRAAFAAAELQEELGNFNGACVIYEKVILADVPASNEAKKRFDLLSSEKINKEEINNVRTIN